MAYDTINDDVTMPGNERALLANRYRIVKQLGQGGMGSVWLAEDTLLDNKQFAIKMLPSILVSDKRAYNQLKSEALVAMKLVHSNIVQIRAFEENNGNPFLVMDYIEGRTLNDYLAEVGSGGQGTGNGLSEEEVVRILRPIAAALDYAHTKGVVHRDVKPGNVMIAKDGTPYVLDFGIAREVQESMTRVTGKHASGTLLYMSPEQLNGDPPTSSQDIYSFAAMVYECLKGEPPFSRGQVEHQILNSQPKGLPEGRFAASVLAGLAKTPEARPTTCVAVLGGAAADVPQPTGLEPGRGRKISVPLAVLAAVALLALLIVGICIALPRRGGGAEPSQPAAPEAVNKPHGEAKPLPAGQKDSRQAVNAWKAARQLDDSEEKLKKTRDETKQGIEALERLYEEAGASELQSDGQGADRNVQDMSKMLKKMSTF